MSGKNPRINLLDYLKSENTQYKEQFTQTYKTVCGKDVPFDDLTRHDLDDQQTVNLCSQFEQVHAINDLISRLEEQAEIPIADVFKEWRKATSYNSYKVNSELFKQPDGKHPIVKAVNKAARK